MERMTKMLRFKEVMEDLGLSDKQLRNFVELKLLNPIYLGKGLKFSQEEILEFQRKYRGKDLSNYEKVREVIKAQELQK